jgi:hypothetical protein
VRPPAGGAASRGEAGTGDLLAWLGELLGGDATAYTQALAEAAPGRGLSGLFGGGAPAVAGALAA